MHGLVATVAHDRQGKARSGQVGQDVLRFGVVIDVDHDDGGGAGGGELVGHPPQGALMVGVEELAPAPSEHGHCRGQPVGGGRFPVVEDQHVEVGRGGHLGMHRPPSLLRTATDTSPGRAGEGQGYRVPPPSVRAGGDTTWARTRYR